MSDPRDVLVFQRSGVIQIQGVTEVEERRGLPLVLKHNAVIIASFPEFYGWAYAEVISLPAFLSPCPPSTADVGRTESHSA